MRIKATGKLTTTKPNKNDKKEPCHFPTDNCTLKEEKDNYDNENYPKLEIISYKRSIQSRIVESLILDLKTIISLYITEEYAVDKFLQKLTIITQSIKHIVYPGKTRMSLEKSNIILLKNVVDSLRREKDDFTLPEKSESLDKNK